MRRLLSAAGYFRLANYSVALQAASSKAPPADTTAATAAAAQPSRVIGDFSVGGNTIYEYNDLASAKPAELEEDRKRGIDGGAKSEGDEESLFVASEVIDPVVEQAATTLETGKVEEPANLSTLSTFVADKVISLRASAAKALCPSRAQLVAAQEHEVARKKRKAAKALRDLQGSEIVKRQLRADIKRQVNAYPHMTSSITGFGAAFMGKPTKKTTKDDRPLKAKDKKTEAKSSPASATRSNSKGKSTKRSKSSSSKK